MAYEKQDDVLNEIEKNSEEDLSSSSEFLTPDQYPIFWKELLKALQGLSGEDNDEVIKQGDITNESLLSYIETRCDLPDETEEGRTISLSTFYRQIKQDAEDEDKKDGFFWNESLEAAVRHFLEFFTFKDNQVLIKIPSDSEDDAHSITVGTIRQADAGYRFTPSEWVRPFWNINDKSYNEVRGHDQVNDILRNENKLQYTRKIDETYKWIRLLMPQYGRRVETEDLNRNWWVIAQVIAAISDFLFDDDSPIENMFDYFLRELTELWENMLYLWLEVAMASQKTNDGVRVIVLPLQADENRTDKRFDNFDDIVTYTEKVTTGYPNYPTINTIYHINVDNANEENIRKEIFKHIFYLAQSYSEQNLCIIPYFRLYNYKHNYYVGEYYRYMFIYNQKEDDISNIDNWNIYRLKEKIGNSNQELIISPYWQGTSTRYSGKIYAFKYNKDSETYSYSYPFSNLANTGSSEQLIMYGGLRTEVGVTFEDSSTEIIPKTINIDVYDSFDGAINPDNISPVGTLSGDVTTEENTVLNYTSNSSHNRIRVSSVETIDCLNITKAAYLGENSTWKDKTNILFNAVINKQWIGSGLQNEKAIFTIKGGNIEKSLEISGKQTSGTFENLTGYDSNGNEIVYTITETGGGGVWIGNKDSDIIKLSNPSVSWRNTAINKEIEIISKRYDNLTDTYNSLKGKIATGGTYYQTFIADIKNDVASRISSAEENYYLYTAHYTTHSGVYAFEACPYVALVSSSYGTTTYDLKIIPFAIEGDPLQNEPGGERLPYPYCPSYTGFGVSTIAYRYKIADGCSYKGFNNSDAAMLNTLIYQRFPDSNEVTYNNIQIRAQNQRIALQNFIVMVQDRATALFARKNDDGIKKAIPYYYKCELTKDSNGKLIIYGTVINNSDGQSAGYKLSEQNKGYYEDGTGIYASFSTNLFGDFYKTLNSTWRTTYSDYYSLSDS